MGIKGLNNFICNNTTNTVSHESMSIMYNKTVIIDISCLIYRYILYNDNKFMNIFKNILKKMAKYRIKPIFVFDGKAPKEKHKTIQKRKDKIQNKLNELIVLENDKLLVADLNVNKERTTYLIKKYLNKSNTNKYVSKNIIYNLIDIKIKKIKKNTLYIKHKHINQIKKYLILKKISFIHTTIEADLICAFFVKNKLVNYCISDDTDMFPYNCNYVIRNINFHEETLDFYNKNQLLLELKIDNTQFLDLCILLGSDYIPRTIGIKPENILYLIKKYYSIENIITNINLINKDEYIKKNIFLNQLNKYNNVRNIFKETFEIKDIIHDINIYCSNISKKISNNMVNKITA
jgi:5'-3' exonuclease